MALLKKYPKFSIFVVSFVSFARQTRRNYLMFDYIDTKTGFFNNASAIGNVRLVWSKKSTSVDQ